jgi:hypothetical protein
MFSIFTLKICAYESKEKERGYAVVRSFFASSGKIFDVRWLPVNTPFWNSQRTENHLLLREKTQAMNFSKLYLHSKPSISVQYPSKHSVSCVP